MDIEMEISIQEATDEMLDTNIFKEVSERNGENFAVKLALWVVRYILVICSMKETLGIDLEIILSKLHGDNNFKKILELTESMFNKVYEQLNKHC